MTTYYISGPMRGKPRYNADQFNEVEKALTSVLTEADGGEAYYRHTIHNPSRNFGGDQTREPNEYMTVDLKQVLEADIIVLLPGWAASEGARREVQVATWTGKRFARAVFTDHWTFEYTELALDEPAETRSVREEMLLEASGLVTGDRNNAYGPPWQDFARTANALTSMGYRGPDDRALESHDVAILVMMVKISRLMWTPAKRDSWVDIAGYAACGLECAIHEEDELLVVLKDIDAAKAEFKAAVSGGSWEMSPTEAAQYVDWNDE